MLDNVKTTAQTLLAGGRRQEAPVPVCGQYSHSSRVSPARPRSADLGYKTAQLNQKLITRHSWAQTTSTGFTGLDAQSI